jgi:hypothetical protein
MVSAPEKKGKGERGRNWGGAWHGEREGEGAPGGVVGEGAWPLLLLWLLSAATCYAAHEFCT